MSTAVQKVNARLGSLHLELGHGFRRKPIPSFGTRSTADAGRHRGIVWAPEPVFDEDGQPLLLPEEGVEGAAFELDWSDVDRNDVEIELNGRTVQFVAWETHVLAYKGNGVLSRGWLPRPAALDVFNLPDSHSEVSLGLHTRILVEPAGGPRTELSDDAVDAWTEVGEGSVQRLRGGQEWRLEAPLAIGARLVFVYVPLFRVRREGLDDRDHPAGDFRNSLMLRLVEAVDSE